MIGYRVDPGLLVAQYSNKTSSEVQGFDVQKVFCRLDEASSYPVFGIAPALGEMALAIGLIAHSSLEYLFSRVYNAYLIFGNVAFNMRVDCDKIEYVEDTPALAMIKLSYGMFCLVDSIYKIGTLAIPRYLKRKKVFANAVKRYQEDSERAYNSDEAKKHRTLDSSILVF